jgi:hypothetical protein
MGRGVFEWECKCETEHCNSVNPVQFSLKSSRGSEEGFQLTLKWRLELEVYCPIVYNAPSIE